MTRLFTLLCVLTLPSAALADARGVGLGVAAGVDYAHYQDASDSGEEFHPSFAWGFFVDIPLLETFYVSPATSLYTLELGDESLSVTDVDLNFKFIVPISSIRLGAGVTAGLTTGLGDYRGHFGGLGYLGLALVSNLEGFILVQYKQLSVEGQDLEKIHAYAGGMFRF
jgi:hypothetical protein